MLHLPILVAAGGVNSAGRTSHRHGFKRMVIDSLPRETQLDTHKALAAMMGISDQAQQMAGTLIRGIEPDYFCPQSLPWSRRVQTEGTVTASMSATQVMSGLSDSLSPTLTEDRRTRVELPQDSELLLPGTRTFEVGAAGQLPTGFKPGDMYPSRSHPRALQMSVYAASDALADLGLSWEDISARVAPDAISVYVSSAMGQLDEDGSGGMLRGRAVGKRVTSKQCPFGFAEMAGDFISAYVLRSMGNTGPALGACATFLYNLQLAVQDIRAGRARVAIVGAAEAPIVAEVMEGYAAMGALSTDKGLRSVISLPSSRRSTMIGDMCPCSSRCTLLRTYGQSPALPEGSYSITRASLSVRYRGGPPTCAPDPALSVRG